MESEKHDYTVVTHHGDVHLTTNQHHSKFEDTEAFIKAHQPTIQTALGLVGTTASVVGLYLSHGRRGPKIK